MKRVRSTMSKHGRTELPTKPHFIQPVVSDLFSNFSIPADFLKYLDGERCQKVQLRSRRRSQPWVVRIEGRRMVDGWEQFVKDNVLHVGEFLLFRYEGHMLFDVIVFGSTACEREYWPPINADNYGLLEDGGVTLETEDNPDISTSPKKRRTYCWSRLGTDCYVGTIKPSYMKSLYFPRVFVLENQLKEATSGILIQDEKGKMWPVELGFKIGTNVVYTKNNGWRLFVKEIGLREGDNFEVRVISRGTKPVLTIRSELPNFMYGSFSLLSRAERQRLGGLEFGSFDYVLMISGKEKAQMSEHENGQNDDEVSELENGVVPEPARRHEAVGGPTQRTKRVSKPENEKHVEDFTEPEIETRGTAAVPATRLEKKNSKHSVRHRKQRSNSTSSGSLTHFYQTSTWPSIERSRLAVNMEFVRANDLFNKCGDIMLKNLNGESWTAKLRHDYKKTQDCFYITSGWRDFALGNGLGVGCRFKMEIEQPEHEVLTFKLCECTPGELTFKDEA